VTDFQFNRRRIFFAALILAALTIAIYWPSRHFDFVDYDDPDYIVENQNITSGLSCSNFVWAFVDQHSANWHPLTWISHQFDCQLFGLNAGPMHLENVFFHCANSILLLLLLNFMTGAFWRSALVAALFALHPLRVESVAWISERKDVLGGFFFLLTLIFYERFAKQSKVQSPKSKVFYRCTLIAFALALLSKPMVVTLPIILLLLDFWPLNRIQNPKFKIRNWKPFLIEKIPFFALSIAIGVITLFAQRAGGAWEKSGDGIFLRLENVAVNYFGYIEKLLWPQNLSFLYLRPKEIQSSEFFIDAIVMLGISGIAVVSFRRRPYLLFGWLWFLVMLLPVCGIFSLARLSIADRYTYLPSIGFYLILTWTVADLGNKISSQRLRNFLIAGGASIVLILCATLTRQQLFVWQNTETLMEHALQVNPDNYVARQNLRLYLFKKEHPNAGSNPGKSANPK
jgi:protein O-mannosyl-transferase